MIYGFLITGLLRRFRDPIRVPRIENGPLTFSLKNPAYSHPHPDFKFFSECWLMGPCSGQGP